MKPRERELLFPRRCGRDRLFTAGQVTFADLRRCAALIAKYHDMDLGLPAASVVAVAERLDINQILTVDERDFRAVRSVRGRPFRLLPADLRK
ncbi:MAG TPA: hypothetical protein VHZ74_22070 [Bryobacteraceae bacterium]|nr:hypothetical protein [Bryobacteraceae bacterium]